LTPVYSYREIIGLGRFKATDVGPQPGENLYEFFSAAMGTGDIWVVVRWKRYEDGQEEPININYLDPGQTEGRSKGVMA
jgi:hypothetical protein